MMKQLISRKKARLVLASLFAALAMTGTTQGATWISTNVSPTVDNWSDTGNWSGGIVANGVGDIASFGPSTAGYFNRLIDLDINPTVGVWSVADGAGNNDAFRFTNPAAIITLDNGANTPVITGTTRTIIEPILAGSNGVTYAGGGNGITIDNINTYTGVTTHTGSTTLWLSNDVQINTNGAFGNSDTAVILDSGGEIYFNSTANNVFERDIIVTAGAGTASIGKDNATGNATFSGDITLGRNVNLYSITAAGVTFSGKISGSGSVTKTGPNSSQLVRITNPNNDYTGETVVHQGTLYIDGDLPLNQPSVFGQGSDPVRIAGQSGSLVYLSFNGSYTMDRGLTVDSTSSVASVLAVIGGSASATINGDVSLSKTPIVYLPSGRSLTINGDVTSPNTSGMRLYAPGGVLTLTGDNTFDGDITFVGSVFSAGTSDGTIIAASPTALGSATGSTTINSGSTLGFQGGFDYANAEPVTISGNGVSGLGAIRSISGNNSFSGPVTLTGGFRIGVDQDTFVLNSDLDDGAGTYNFTKVGNGSLVLTGNLTYDGTTTVTGGSLEIQDDAPGDANVSNATLIVNTPTGGVGNLTITNGTVELNNAAGVGATSINATNSDVYGNTTITGNVDLNGSSSLNPGNSAGTMDIGGNVTFDGVTSIYNVEILAQPMGFAYDQILVGGDLDLGGNDVTGSQLQFALTTPVQSWQLLFIAIVDDAQTTTGNFIGKPQGSIVTLTPGNFARISYVGDSNTNSITGGNDIVLYDFNTAIPEPTTMGLLSLAGLVMLRRRRA